MAKSSRLIELSNITSENMHGLDTWLLENNISSPSFGPNAPLLEEAFPSPITAAKLAIVEATLELRDLVQGQRTNIISAILSGRTDCGTLFAQRITQKVALDDTRGISYAELAAQTGVDERAVTRIIRNAMAFRLFHEETPGRVTHFGCQSAVGAGSADTAASVYHAATPGGDLMSFYQILDEDPEAARAFGAAMSLFQKDDGFSLHHNVDGYAWGGLPTGSTVVDIGGSQGQLASAVLAKHGHLKFVVQDLPSTISTAAPVFAPSPVTGALMYVLRCMLHNWPDIYALRMLEGLVPTLTPGSRVLVIHTVMPPPGAIPNTSEREVRWLDLAMLTIFNAGDRTVEEWERLFASADSRLKYQGIKMVECGRLSFIEVVW